MRPDTMNDAEAQAIDWVIRQRDEDFSDWDSFAEWLAENSSHSDIYDAVASLDLDLEAMPKPVRKGMAPPARNQVTRRRWFGAAAAAVFVGALGLTVPTLWSGGERIVTAAGERRTITLDDGSRIELNGGSTIELGDRKQRFARIESGEAMFHVVHRDDDPFVVEAGEARIVDLGTAFNVVRNSRQTRLAVSEGLVVYNAKGGKVRVAEGQGIDVHDDDRRLPAPSPVDSRNIGGWRTGLLVYNEAPLTIVAEDLRRTAAIALTVDSNVSDISFRGALVIDEDRSRTVADLAALSGTRVERRGEGWHLTR